MITGKKLHAKDGTIWTESLDVQCYFMIKSFIKYGISNGKGGTENDLLWDTDDEAIIDLHGTEWDPYGKFLSKQCEDILEELFALDGECKDFARF